MTGIAQQDFDLLRGAIDGPVIGQADVDYDDARKVLNAVIDRRPAVIARCLSATDVSGAWRSRCGAARIPLLAMLCATTA